MNIFAQNNESKEFIAKFNEATVKLKFEKFTEALPLLMELDKMDPDNPNIKYLTGVCYVATNTEKDKALELLQYAIKFNTNEYSPSYHKERRTPIYALYYLGVCYCQHKKCAEAKKTFDEFANIIADNSNDYVEDARYRLSECTGEPIAVKPKEKPQPVVAKTETKGNADLTKGLKSKKIVFKTKDALYAVQIGAFLQQLPNTNFPNIKNVKSFVDNNGVIRYVVGGTVLRANAEELKKWIVNAGYKDAFIVDINTQAKFEQEVFNAFNVINPEQDKKKWAKLVYKVQVGAYRTKEKMREDMAKKFLTIEGIENIAEGDMILTTVGNFGNYEDADKYKKLMIEQGVAPDAFIIVYKNGEKTTTKEAEKFSNKEFK